MAKIESKNPLLREWKGPFSAPPFSLIKPEHFMPAIETAIKDAASEIAKITGNNESPSFSNTIEALEVSGKRLADISAILFNINSADTNTDIQKAAQEVSAALTRFSNDITLNRKLFERVKSVYDSASALKLDPDQEELLEKRYRSFVNGGAALDAAKKRRFRKISEELASLSLTFEENLLAETNAYELNIRLKKDLAGLPGWLVENAEREAKERGKKGWIFTLHFPSYLPFMQYSSQRKLRKKMFLAYASRCFRGNDNDNSAIVGRVVELRLELARLLGHKSFAELALSDRMANEPEKVMSFLDDLHRASRPAARQDLDRIKAYAARAGHKGKVERWDWSFYSEKLKKELYGIDDEVLKPYFRLEQAEKAIFDLANRLYGLNFVRNNTIDIYNPEVSAYEVYDSDRSFLGVLFTDYHPRAGKNGGAWMTSYREQRVENGLDTRPLISIVTNFTRPSETTPSLLSFNELTTFLHEFGHALHGILSKCRYESLSGTNVARDFVELPSQFMENYAYEKEWLDTWAYHYKTGEKIPAEIIARLKESSVFIEGYSCQRQLGFAFLDMAWHMLTDKVSTDLLTFERSAMQKTEMFNLTEGTCVSTSFGHIFSGGYAAGYYGYKWAEVLDADAFSLFSAKGVFNREVSDSFRKNILEKGGSEKPLKLYISFRGKEPDIDAFLERSGLKK